MSETFPREENNVIPIERGRELQKGKAVEFQKKLLHHIQSVEAYRDNLQEKKAKTLKNRAGLEITRLFKKIERINEHIAEGKVLLEDGTDVRAMAKYLISEWRPAAEEKKAGESNFIIWLQKAKILPKKKYFCFLIVAEMLAGWRQIIYEIEKIYSFTNKNGLKTSSRCHF